MKIKLKEKHLSLSKKDTVPEGDWGWIVVFGGFVNFMIFCAFNSTIGMVYNELIEKWGADQESLQWIGSLQSGVALCMGALAPFLINVFSYKLLTLIGGLLVFFGVLLSAFTTSVFILYMTLGIMPGIGNGLCISTALIITNEYFSKKLPLANGIVLCGCGVGQVMFSPIFERCLREYGYQGALLISSAFSLNIQISVMVFKRRVQKTDNVPISKVLQQLLDRQLLKSPAFILSLLSNCFVCMGHLVVFSFLPNTAINNGVDEGIIAWLISLIGLANVFGRPFCGWIAFKFYRQRILTFIILLIICAISIAALQISTQLKYLILTCTIFGATSGGAITMSYSVLPDIVMASSLNNSVGMTFLSQGIGAIIGSPLAGLLAKVFHNDNVLYTYGGLMYFLGALTLFPVMYLTKRKKTLKKFYRKTLFSIDLKYPEIVYHVDRRSSVTNSYWSVTEFS